MNNSCRKSGIKIHESNNNYSQNPFEVSNLNTHTINNNHSNTKTTAIDLNIDNYSIADICKLFNITDHILNDETMKESKKIVLKTHPDKSNLDSKYFLFYSKAYKRLYGIYEFQNKSDKKNVRVDHSNSENGKLLDNMLKNNKGLQDPVNFNKWFNTQFEKHNMNDTDDNGYGDWLKSDDGLYDTGNVSKSNMASEFEKQKKQIQSLTLYEGVGDRHSSIMGGSLLKQQNNYTSDNGMYTDLRQAYVESVIPVTEDDYNKIPKYKNVAEYKSKQVTETPMDKETAMKQLLQQNRKDDHESVATAYYYAQQSEKTTKKTNSFWSELKQLTF